MKKTCLFAILAAFVCLQGCRTGKMVKSENTAVSRFDTGFVSTGKKTEERIVADSAEMTVREESETVVEFVEGGGTITLDSTGNVTMKGVKAVKGKERAGAKKSEVKTGKETTEETRDERNSATREEYQQQKQEQQTKANAPKWYDGAFAKVGKLCCIAALLWIIFLYLKKKI